MRDAASSDTAAPRGADAPKVIGLPPREDERPEPTSKDLMGGRLLNAIGLVSPVSNVAMLEFSPKDMRWMGVVAGIILWLVGGWATVFETTWLNRGAFGLHYVLVVLGLMHPRWPEVPFRAWTHFGVLLGHVFMYPIFALLYFLVVTPTALLMRVMGNDPLRRKAPPEGSYWQDHEMRDRERFHRQF